MSSLPASPTNERAPAGGAQAVLGIFLAVLLGLLAYRGYGAHLGAWPTEPVAADLTDLNAATAAELSQVPGIGPKTAEAIVLHRQINGPFRSVEELRNVRGIGALTLDKVRHRFRAGAPSAPSQAPQDGPEPIVSTSFSSPLPRTPAPAPRATPAGAKKIQPGEPPINVNTAPPDELQRLPGVGPVTAQAIVAAREAKPFETVNDLDRAKGIGPKTLDKLRPFVVVR